MITDRYTLRENNEQLVLSTLIEEKSISRAQISKMTGLNKASVSDIANKLIENQFIHEVGSGTSTTSGGRKPILLQLNKNAGLTLTIDLGYDYVSYLVTYLNGEILKKETLSIQVDKSSCIEVIQNIYQEQSTIAEESPYGIISLSIAIHGIVSDNRIVFTPYYDLDKIDIYGILSEELSIPIHIENEANLSALAEKTFSTTVSNLVSISVHSGVGAGIIVNNELYHGRDGRSGEIGHTILYPHGKKCPCGNQGCLEQYSSQKAVLSAFQETKKDNQLTLPDLIRAYSTGDAAASELIKNFALYLSIGINNVIASYGPEKVYLHSTLVTEIPELVSLVKEHIVSSFSVSIPIENSALQENAVLLGGSALSIQHFFNLSSLYLGSNKQIQ